jgi:hypothetical protein
MSEKVAGLTRLARSTAGDALTLKVSGETKRALEFMQAAIQALAEAVDDLSAKLERGR